MPTDTLETFTDSNWEREVLGSHLPVAVGFWAEWCVPCRTVTGSMESAAEKLRGRLRVGRLNVDENAAVTSRYAIKGLPTLVIFKGGQAAARRVGLMGREDLLDLFEEHAQKS